MTSSLFFSTEFFHKHEAAMGKVNALPTLSTSGWVTAPGPRADLVLVYYFLTDKLQTSLYGNNATSLPWTLQQNPNDMEAACDAIRRELNTYLARYYETVTVLATIEDTEPLTSSSKTTINLGIVVQQDGVTYSVNQLLTVVDGKLAEFMAVNNGT